MKLSYPPRLAVWLLKYFGPETNLEALAGDLQEAFSQGKSNAWYWRQVVAAIAWRKHLRLLIRSAIFGWLLTLPPDFREKSHFVGRPLHIAIITIIWFVISIDRKKTQSLPCSLTGRELIKSDPDADRARMIETLHLDMLQETDPELRTAYEQAIIKLKSNQTRDSIQPI
ncbi:MAG TPA: hypothetical protein VFR24_06865 [Candidatus Angelobacter sp.]|nr:hypothetical protein [Candidatus Angelobacter sp.]